jgi:hypothetical protein
VAHHGEPFAERGDGGLVGEVDGLGADAWLAGVGGVQRALIPAGRGNLRARVAR